MAQIITVDFHGDQLFGFKDESGSTIALKPIVEAMGVDWSSQLKRLKRDPILKEGMVIMTTPFGRGGDQEAVCLRLDLINGWLFKIDTRRIKKAEVREKVLEYQREGYDVLYRHFHGISEPASEAVTDEMQAHEPEGVKLRMVTEARQTFGTKASGQLWFQLGLPVVPAMMETARQLELIDFSRIKTAEN